MPQLVRVGALDRQPVEFILDGRPATALEGDTLLTAILTLQKTLRGFEFDGSRRAGFCLIGACQDCWVMLENGARARACTTFISAGLKVSTANGS